MRQILNDDIAASPVDPRFPSFEAAQEFRCWAENKTTVPFRITRTEGAWVVHSTDRKKQAWPVYNLWADQIRKRNQKNFRQARFR